VLATFNLFLLELNFIIGRDGELVLFLILLSIFSGVMCAGLFYDFFFKFNRRRGIKFYLFESLYIPSFFFIFFVFLEFLRLGGQLIQKLFSYNFSYRFFSDI
jgi:hypothetical protein